MKGKKSVFDQIKERFDSSKYEVSSHIPCLKAINNICIDAKKGKILPFVKLYRIINFGVTTTDDELKSYCQCMDEFDKLEGKWKGDFRSLDEVSDSEALSGLQFSRTAKREKLAI